MKTFISVKKFLSMLMLILILMLMHDNMQDRAERKLKSFAGPYRLTEDDGGLLRIHR